jgi:hypothetical protein
LYPIGSVLYSSRLDTLFKRFTSDATEYLGVFAVGADKLSLKVGASLCFRKRACAPDRREGLA